MLDHLPEGDFLLVTRLNHQARSTRDPLQVAKLLRECGAGLGSMAEPWGDTTTPAGRMILTVFAGIADFERSLIVERTSNGRQVAKARGLRFGPRPSLTFSQIANARELSDGGKPLLRLRNSSASIVRRSTGRSVRAYLDNPLAYFGVADFGGSFADLLILIPDA